MGKILRCEALRDGSLEIELAREEDASRAMRQTTFSFSTKAQGKKVTTTISLTVTPHRTKNTSKGVITCYDLKETNETDIVDGLAAAGVVNAVKIKTKRGPELIPTNSIILTFNRKELPTEVAVGYLRVKVRPYVPNPMRCFRCQRFGHTKMFCRNQVTCGRCADTGHTVEDCTSETLRCVNCGEGTNNKHASYDKTCPTLCKEKEINTLKATRNISFKEARELYNSTRPRVSYAQKVGGTSSPREPAVGETSVTQLLTMLKSMGLLVVPAASLSGGTAPRGLAASTDAVTHPVPTVREIETQTDPDVVDGSGSAVAESDGWTTVQPRRRNRRSPPPPSPPTGAQVRQGDAEPRETPRGADAVPSSGNRTRSVSAEACQARSPSRMGPPPPPPPRRPPPPPPPPPLSPREARPPGVTPPVARGPNRPPSAPGRPNKRPIPWTGSPTEGSSPSTRKRAEQNPVRPRAGSADGRLPQEGGVRSRISFGDVPPSPTDSA